MTLRGSEKNASILPVDAIPSRYRNRRSDQRTHLTQGGRSVRCIDLVAVYVYAGWSRAATGAAGRAEGGAFPAGACLFLDGSADSPEVLPEGVGRFGCPPRQITIEG